MYPFRSLSESGLFCYYDGLNQGNIMNTPIHKIEAGDKNEVSDHAGRAPFKVVHPDEGRSWWIVDDYQTHMLGGRDTNGLVSLWYGRIEVDSGPPAHLHHNEDEIFVVLEGELTFYTEDSSQVTGPGSVVYAPRGQPHTFCNTGKTRARMLVLTTPAGIEDYFAATAYHGSGSEGRPAPTKEEIDRLMAMAPAHGIEFCQPE